jgi:hypothetical protein
VQRLDRCLPLKDTERRADRWVTKMGVEQTEIDALAALDPDTLERIARDAIDCFYDRSLDEQVAAVRQEWLAAANAAVAATLDLDERERVKAAAAERLAELRTELAALRDDLDIDLDAVELRRVARAARGRRHR